MSTNFCCEPLLCFSAPMPASMDLYPPSTCTKIGRLLNRIVTWFPTNLTTISLSAGIISLVPTSPDISLKIIIVSALSILFATIGIVFEGINVCTIIDSNRMMEHERSILRKVLPLRHDLTWEPVKTIRQLVKTKYGMPFIKECNAFDDQNLDLLLFEYWVDKKSIDIFKEPIDSLQFIVDEFPSDFFSTSRAYIGNCLLMSFIFFFTPNVFSLLWIYWKEDFFSKDCMAVKVMACTNAVMGALSVYQHVHKVCLRSNNSNFYIEHLRLWRQVNSVLGFLRQFELSRKDSDIKIEVLSD